MTNPIDVAGKLARTLARTLVAVTVGIVVIARGDRAPAQAPPAVVHPTIAPLRPGLALSSDKESPFFNLGSDTKWNHGESFGPASGPGFQFDRGGWLEVEEDPEVSAANLYPYVYSAVQTNAPPPGWHAHTWQDPYHEQGSAGISMLRFVAYLRPPLNVVPVLLGVEHPWPEVKDPANTLNRATLWIDNAAVEIFAPPMPHARRNRKVVLIVGCMATFGISQIGGKRHESRGCLRPTGCCAGYRVTRRASPTGRSGTTTSGSRRLFPTA
jgi:hypothetical protein